MAGAKLDRSLVNTDHRELVCGAMVSEYFL